MVDVFQGNYVNDLDVREDASMYASFVEIYKKQIYFNVSSKQFNMHRPAVHIHELNSKSHSPNTLLSDNPLCIIGRIKTGSGVIEFPQGITFISKCKMNSIEIDQ